MGNRSEGACIHSDNLLVMRNDASVLACMGVRLPAPGMHARVWNHSHIFMNYVTLMSFLFLQTKYSDP